MPKLKTKKAVKKRFKITAKGNIKFVHTNRSHRAFGKTTKQKRHLRKPASLPNSSYNLIERTIPYRNKKGQR